MKHAVRVRVESNPVRSHDLSALHQDWSEMCVYRSVSKNNELQLQPKLRLMDSNIRAVSSVEQSLFLEN